MSTYRSRSLKVSGAALMVGLLALSGCSSTGGDGTPATTGQSTAQSPSTTSEPMSTAPSSDTAAPSSNTASSPGPTSTSGSSGSTPPGTPSESNPQPIPTNAVDYADALILAWGSGEQERMKQLAQPAALDALAEYGASGGPHWKQVGHDAGAGSVFVSYKNSEDGATLELRVRNEAASKGQEHAVAEAKFDG